MHKLVTALFIPTLLLPLSAAETGTPEVRIFIEPQNGFETHIEAAFFKKHVPATVENVQENATLVLRSGPIQTQEEKSGLGKLARSAYALCVGIDGSQTVSVQLVDPATNKTVWAYSVRKPRAENFQSSAEAIAKHLKEFLDDDAKAAKKTVLRMPALRARPAELVCFGKTELSFYVGDQKRPAVSSNVSVGLTRTEDL
jgi:hypothetical protein